MLMVQHNERIMSGGEAFLDLVFLILLLQATRP